MHTHGAVCLEQMYIAMLQLGPIRATHFENHAPMGLHLTRFLSILSLTVLVTLVVSCDGHRTASAPTITARDVPPDLDATASQDQDGLDGSLASAQDQSPTPSQDGGVLAPIAENDVGYSVSGVVLQNEQPVEGALVQLDDYINLIAYTDPNGHFEIDDVASGEYEISVRQGETTGSFAERRYDVAIAADVMLSELTLPVPTVLEEPEPSAGLQLSWSATDAEDFREYKLYRHDSSGLDETTGELVHVSTERLETTFVDEDLRAGDEYFYRLYVMNDKGRLGGSNIVSAVVPNQNLLSNGDFEELAQDGFAAGWNRYGTPSSVVTLDDGIAASGTSSIKMVMPESYEYWVQQQVSSAGLTTDDRLRITGFYMTDRADPNIDTAVVVADEYLTLDPPTVANEWLPFSVEVFVPDLASFRVLFWSIGPFDALETTLWFDDVRVERVP